MSGIQRIQRQQTKGWRLPKGAVYVGRPTLFGNPWQWRDAPEGCAVDTGAGWRYEAWGRTRRMQWAVDMYRDELQHLGLLGRYAIVDDRRLAELLALAHELGGESDLSPPSIIPLFRHLLRDATALACWCPLDQLCHADVLIELLDGSAT